MERPFVWQMIKEAIESLNGKATYPEIKNYINEKWTGVNENTINAQIIVLTVNQPSRIHYPENKKPRISNTQYDLLYTTGRGTVVLYNPEEHGTWEIFKNDLDALGVRQLIVDEIEDENITDEGSETFLFPIEANLRDFIIKNLHVIKGHNLRLYQDVNGRDGKEYPTGVGPIDILATDDKGNFFVFELKLSRGADRALGQLLRYMGWVKRTIAAEKTVRGIIVANKMDEKLKYAVTITPDILLYEYHLKFDLNKTALSV